ncbi:MAG: DNA polymerase III subunit delta [Solirubrobacteraceae bacterium]
MAALKPAYLIHGDDHGAIAERRAGLRALAEAQDAGAGVELLEGEAGTPAGVARALATMTLTLGGMGETGAAVDPPRRVIVVEGVERWRQGEVEEHLVPVMREMPPDTTLALFAREDNRAKAPAAIHEAVKRAGGQVVVQGTVKPWELPGWVREQASRMGMSLDTAAAKALVGQVGARQQRLLRELEKLALSSGSAGGGQEGLDATSTPVSVEDIERGAAHSAQSQAYALADALVAGDQREATLSYLRLREQGERLSGLTYMMAQRLREAVAIALRLRAGESAAEVRRGLRIPARAAERLVADVARGDPDRLRRALCALADLELDSRGGAPLSGARSVLAQMHEDTLALRAIEAITV